MFLMVWLSHNFDDLRHLSSLSSTISGGPATGKPLLSRTRQVAVLAWHLDELLGLGPHVFVGVYTVEGG